MILRDSREAGTFCYQYHMNNRWSWRCLIWTDVAYSQAVDDRGCPCLEVDTPYFEELASFFDEAKPASVVVYGRGTTSFLGLLM